MSFTSRTPPPYRGGSSSGAQVDRGVEALERARAEKEVETAERGIWSTESSERLTGSASTLYLTALLAGRTRDFKVEEVVLWGAAVAGTVTVSVALYTIDVNRQGSFTARRLIAADDVSWDTTEQRRRVPLPRALMVDRRRRAFAVGLVADGSFYVWGQARPLFGSSFSLAGATLPAELTFGTGLTPMSRWANHIAVGLPTRSTRRLMCDL